MTQVSTNFQPQVLLYGGESHVTLGAHVVHALGSWEPDIGLVYPPNMTKKSVVKLPSCSSSQSLSDSLSDPRVQSCATHDAILISDSDGGPRPQPQQLQPQPLSRCSRLLSTCADKHNSHFDGIID